ncbi:MAG TPA: DUF1254 domain-containing protein [Vicinamibacterales bacterium]|jgi:hypothetical protein
MKVAIAAAEPFSPWQLAERTKERRAIEAVIWGMPIVSVDAMRQAFFRVGATYNDVLFFSRPADWKLQVTTPNASSLYAFFQFNLANGPIVVDLPAAVGAGLFGSILDAWQVPLTDVGPEGEDAGKGGRYLLLPPDFRSEVRAGDFVVRSATYNGYAALRAIPASHSDEDTAKALALVKQLRVYPLESSRAPAQRYIDIAGTLFDGIARMDDTFFDSLARMVNEEPMRARDMVAIGQLRSIGIEKGKPFMPDAALRAILKNAAVEAQAMFMNATTAGVVPYWSKMKWGSPAYVLTGAQTAFTYQTGDQLNVDDRGAMFFFACAGPKKLGAATLYLIEARDSTNALLEGGTTYRLHVPPNVPARQFWAVTVYDLETAAFIREAPTIEINSYQDLQKNQDGSVDVFFGPRPVPGKESNCVQTIPGRHWVAAFRFYGPDESIRDRTWTMGDIERVK